MAHLARASAFAVPVVLMASCAALNVYDTGAGVKRTPKPKDCEIPVLRTKVPDRPYVEIATMQWAGGFDAHDPPAAERQVRERACALGADAVIVGAWVPGNPGGTNGHPPQMNAVAIVYQPAPAADAVANPAK